MRRWPIYAAIWIALALVLVRAWRVSDSGAPVEPAGHAAEAVTDAPRRVGRNGGWGRSDRGPVGPTDGLAASRDAAMPSHAATPSAASREAPFAIANEHVIRFRRADEARRFAALAAAEGATVAGRIPGLNLLRIRVRDAAQWERLREALPPDADHSPNHLIWHPERRVPPDPPAGVVYAPFGAGAPVWLGLDSPRLPGGPVTVAVLDDGIVQHWALDGTPLRAFDLLGDATESGGSHGSAMASLIAGHSADAPGVAAGVELLSYRVLGPDGEGDTFALAEAIMAAVEAGAAVINCSLGTYGDNLALREAVTFAHAEGVTVVASVGNDGLDGTLMYPAGYASVIAVAAVDADGRHAWFSNRGVDVDVAAPGYQVQSAWMDGQVAQVSGTSPAAALVSGGAARLLSADPSLEPDAVREILRDTSDDFGAPGPDAALGAGIVNLDRMERRERRGLYEMSARPPHVIVDDRTPERYTGLFFAQNSGTETVPRVELTVAVDGVIERAQFEAVPPGDNVVMTRDLGARTDGPRTVAVRLEAAIQGAPGAPPPVGRLEASIRLE